MDILLLQWPVEFQWSFCSRHGSRAVGGDESTPTLALVFDGVMRECAVACCYPCAVHVCVHVGIASVRVLYLLSGMVIFPCLTVSILAHVHALLYVHFQQVVVDMWLTQDTKQGGCVHEC